MLIGNVEFHANEHAIFSIGLQSRIQKELWIEKGQLSLAQLKPILTYLVDFIQADKLTLRHGEKLSCFSWSIKIRENGAYFEIYEFYPKELGFIPGLALTHQLFAAQVAMAQQLQVHPQFPLFDQNITIDPWVKKGLAAHLFRWNKKDPDSGWVAMTAEFTGNASSFERMTIGQFMILKPESRPFLALPPGFKVIWDGNDAKLGFDKKMSE